MVMKKPYSHRWVPKYFVMAVVFGVVFLAVLSVLNYLNQEKVKEYDMVFWNSFFTIAMTYWHMLHRSYIAIIRS